MSDRLYDVVIVGGGAAGLTAALYSARRGLSTLVVSQDIGGQAATTSQIENYPGLDVTDGFELMSKIKEQGEKYGSEVRIEDVQRISEAGENTFQITTAVNSYRSRTIILAFGLTHRRLNVPGEEKFIGRGISYCATCDAPLYEGKRVVVVGGGNSAMDAALLLARFATSVDLLTINPELRGERILIDRIMNEPKITTHLGVETVSVEGDDHLTGIQVQHDGQTETVVSAGVFVEIGFTINPGLVKDIVALDQRNQIVIDPKTNGTSVLGLFAAGDVTTIAQKQIVISAGEGAKAALSAYQYLQSVGHVPPTGVVDWGVKTPHHHEHPSQLR